MKSALSAKTLVLFIFLVTTLASTIFVLETTRPYRQTNNTLAFAAGRSGGHIVPARTIAAQHKAQNPTNKTLFFSTATALDRQLLENRPEIDVHIVHKLENVPRINIFQLILYLGKALAITARSYLQLMHHRAFQLQTTGGYIALPVTIAAWCAGIPVTLYELNVVPGNAALFVHLLAHITKCPFKIAQKAFLFPQSTEHAPYPIRFTNKDCIQKQNARKLLDIPAEKQVIAIIGGSQGSHFLNTVLPDAIAALNKKDIFVIQQTGAEDVATVQSAYAHYGIPALVFSFCSDIHHIYSAADLCISRAGAGSIFELLFFKLPTIIIPLETAITDHQLDNARAMVSEQGHLFSLIRQQELVANSKLLTDKIEKQLEKTNLRSWHQNLIS